MTIIARWVLNWLYRNAVAKVYFSRVIVGRHLGGKDIPELPDGFIVLDVRVAGKILVLGYFQTT